MTLLDSLDGGWLVPPEFREKTPHAYGRSNKPGRIKPVECVVYHYTASPRGADKYGASEKRIRSWLSGARGVSSTHFVVLRNGVIIQGAPLQARTWHAGQAYWADPATGELRKYVNNFSIGVDLENVGHLSRKGFGWVDTYGRQYDDGSGGPFVTSERRAWEPYTVPQMAAACELTARLVEAFPHLVNEHYADTKLRLVGHEHVAPTRKVDPGPAFDWDAILEAANVAGGLNVCE
jgi:N-acetylmuramoyl-L-alanine amidase